MNANTNPLGWPTWQWRSLIALSLVITSFCTAAGLSHIARAAGVLRDWPIEPHMTIESPARTPAGWYRVTQVLPNGAAEQAGLRPGDFVRGQAFAVPPGAVLAPGVRLPLTVDRHGYRFTATIIVPEQPSVPSIRGPFVFASQGLAGIVSAVLGFLLVVLRGRRDRAAAMLGMVLQCLGWSTGGYGFLWAPALIVYQFQQVLSILSAAGICFFLPLAGFELSGAGHTLAEKRLVPALSALLAGAVVVVWLVAGSDTGPTIWLMVGGILLAAVLFLRCIIRNYRHHDARARNRINIVLLAFGAYLASFVLFFWFIAVDQSLDHWWAITASAAAGLAGPTLIAYAVLRQKLFDLNFALNRTLVYATVSFVVLAAFGLAKWVIEHLIPEEWHAGSEYYSVGIALGLFLVLHRVHNWVERNVERVFFRPWHHNEEALRRFVSAAGHFDRIPVLCAAFAEELRRFAKGASAALYLREADGSYALACGSLAGAHPDYAGDDLALALMRAERGPVRIASTSTALPGALALPMLDHGRLAGFALLAGKPDGTDYRPDEVEVLGWAAHQVGLDLQAMHAGEFEAEVAALNAKVASLAEERDRLGSLLVGSASVAEGHAGLRNPRRKPRQRKENAEKVTG